MKLSYTKFFKTCFTLLGICFITLNVVEAKTFTCNGILNANEMGLPTFHPDLLGTGKKLTSVSTDMEFYQAYQNVMMKYSGEEEQDINNDDDKYFIDTKTNKVYYCMMQYLLTGADAATFEVLSDYISKDKNTIYFLNSAEDNTSSSPTTYSIITNDKKINTNLLKNINLTNIDFDRGNYYSYGNGVFMINGFYKNTGDYMMEYRIIPLGIKKSQLTGIRQEGTVGIFVGKNPLIYGAILSGAKLPLDMSPVFGSNLAVTDADGKIWKYKDKFGKVVSGPRYLEFGQLINSPYLGSWHLSKDAKIIDDYIVYDEGLYYANREQGMLITNIDNASFRSIGGYYQDRNNTYAKLCLGSDFVVSQGGFINCELQILNNLNGSLISLGAGYAKDNKNLYYADSYYGATIWTGDGLWDLESFMGKSWSDNIMMGYGDKNRFYCTRGEYGFPTIMLTGVDVNNIKLIDDQYWMDNNSVYRRECDIWTGVDASTFRSVMLSGQSVGLYADKSGLYFGMFNQDAIKDIDLPTLSVVGFVVNYSLVVKDKNGFYILNGGMVGGYPKIAKLPISSNSYNIIRSKTSQGDMISIEDSMYKCDGYGSGNTIPWQNRCTKKT